MAKRFKIGDWVMHKPNGTHTIVKITGYGPKGYMVAGHSYLECMSYGNEQEWELYNSRRFKQLIKT